MDKKAFNGRFVENEGMSAADLERGYSMTGDIPEDAPCKAAPTPMATAWLPNAWSGCCRPNFR